jgi:hypothetical protein
MVLNVKGRPGRIAGGWFITGPNVVTTRELRVDSGDWFPVDSEVLESVKMDTMMVVSPKGRFWNPESKWHVSAETFRNNTNVQWHREIGRLTLDEERYQAEAYVLEPAII